MNVAGISYRDRLAIKARERVQFNRGFDLAIELVTRAKEFEGIMLQQEVVRKCTHSFAISDHSVRMNLSADFETSKGFKTAVVSAVSTLETFANSPQSIEVAVEALYKELRKSITAIQGKK